MRVTLIAILVLVPVLARGQAVSALNEKLGYSYGQLDSNTGQTVTGSVAFPVSASFGAQVDGLYTRVSQRDFYGTGAHFFWRDPDRALLGVSVGGVHTQAVETYETGVEAEYYWRWLTFGTYSGVSTIRYADAVPFISTDKTMGFGSFYVGFYPLPDLLVRPGYTVKLGNSYSNLDIEYEIPRQNLTLTADLAKGDHGYNHAMFGVRYYFGGEKSLKGRHRQDDPGNVAAGALTAIGTYGAEYNEKAKAYYRDLAESSGGGSYGSVVTFTGSGSGSYGSSSTYNFGGYTWTMDSTGMLTVVTP